VFIAPLFWLDDRPFLAIALTNAALGIVYMFAARSWLARYAEADASWLAATCAMNASVGILLRRTLSEALFMPGLMLTALALERLRFRARERLPVLAALGAGVALAIVCLTRQAGFALLPGFTTALAWMAHQRQLPWRRAAAAVALVAAPALLAVVGLSVYERSTAAGNARTYADYLAGDAQSLPAQLVTGLKLRVSEIGRITLPGMFKSSPDAARSGWLNLSLFALTTLAVLYGASRILRDAPDTLVCTAPFYVGLYIVWPFDEGIRFLAPLAPVWFLSLYCALPDRPLWRHRVAWLGLAAHLIVALGYWLRNDLPEARRDHAHWQAIDRVAASIDTSSGPVGWRLERRDHERVMLQVALDRRVPDVSSADAIDRKFMWLVTADTATTPPEYVKITAVGDYVLWRRGIP
jgi:hypothetical protein